MSSFPDLLTSFDEIVQALKVKLSQDPSASTTYNGEQIRSIAADVVAHYDGIQSELNALTENQQSGVVVFQTYALLDAYTPTTEQETGSFKVVNDPDGSLNGYYSWVSGTVYQKDASLLLGDIDYGNPDGVEGGKIFNTLMNTYSSVKTLPTSSSSYHSINEPLPIGMYAITLVDYAADDLLSFYVKGVRSNGTEELLSKYLSASGDTDSFYTTEPFATVKIIWQKNTSEAVDISYSLTSVGSNTILKGSSAILKGGTNLPNIDTQAGTISFDTDSSFVINGLYYSLAEAKYKNIPIKAAESSTSLLVFNQINTSLTIKNHNYTLQNGDTLIGSFKTNYGTDYSTFINAVFAFEVTVDGLTSKCYAERINTVEAQINNEYPVLNQFYGIADVSVLPMTQDYNIDLSVGVGNVVSLTPENVFGYHYALVDCVAGDVFIVNGTGGVSPRLWGFLDSDNKLLSVSEPSLTATSLKLTAPANAVKLIVNDRDGSDSFKGEPSLVKSVDNNTDNIVEMQKKTKLFGLDNVSIIEMESEVDAVIALGNVGVGNVASLTPEYASNYRYAVVTCATGDKFTISGTGGSNPRLWGFLDKDNVVLSMSTAALTADMVEITAPLYADKLIINDNSGAVSMKGRDNITPRISTLENIDYVTEVPDDSIPAMIKGLKMSDEIQNVITDFAKDGDLMVHVSSFCIINDVVYVTYYANITEAEEDPNNHIARFVYCELADLNNKTFIDLFNVGDVYDGKTCTAIYDTILLRKDDTTLYLMFTAALDGEYTRLYRTFNVGTEALGAVSENTFTVGLNTEPYSISGMQAALAANRIEHKPLFGDIGIMQKLTSRNEGGTDYYYTGCYVGGFNCIIKSSDLIDWEFVSQPDFDNDSQWENSVYVKDDRAYYFCRQYTTSKYGFLSYYDLIERTWAKPVMVQDAQSRSDFIEWGGKLYLIHAPKDRYHLSVMEINPYRLHLSHETQVARTPNYFYPYTQVYNGELYISFTDSRRHIYLSKFSIDSISTETILNEFRTVFASILG